jgi:hypothetical protein
MNSSLPFKYEQNLSSVTEILLFAYKQPDGDCFYESFTHFKFSCRAAIPICSTSDKILSLSWTS